MNGAFLMSREIFGHDVFTDIKKFRIFFWIIGHAVFSEKGVVKGGIRINRGQYLRSFRNLREDLVYYEKNAEKYYSLSTIKDKIEDLVEEGSLIIEETRLGTLFTVVNYEQYQGFERYKTSEKEEVPNSNRTANEQLPNGNGTPNEQLPNNKNLGIKDINALKGFKDLTTTSTTAAPAPQVDGFAKALQTFEANICRLGPIQMESLGKWFDDFDESYEIIEEAVKIAADSNKKTFRFVEYLLQEWTSNKLQTIDQVRTYERNKFNNAPAKQGNNNQPRPSYRNKPMREEILPEWFGKPEEEPARETVPASNDHLEAEKQKVLARLAARREKGNGGN